MSYVEVEMYAPLRVFPWLLWTKLSLNSSPSHPEVVYFADGPSTCIKGKNMWDKYVTTEVLLVILIDLPAGVGSSDAKWNPHIWYQSRHILSPLSIGLSYQNHVRQGLYILCVAFSEDFRGLNGPSQAGQTDELHQLPSPLLEEINKQNMRWRNNSEFLLSSSPFFSIVFLINHILNSL